MQTSNALNALSHEDASILIVDDIPANLLAMEAVLERLTKNLVRALSGPEALEKAASREFAAIILDVQMPGMDGLETAVRMRSIEYSRNTPIIFVTAGDLTDDLVRRAYVEGAAVDFLFKPYSPEILRSKVQVFVDLFNRSQQLKQSITELERTEEVVRELNHRLERRVNERTSELRSALSLAEANETRYKKLAEFLPQIVWTAAPDGKITYFNTRWYEYTAVPREQPLDEWVNVVHPDDRDIVRTLWGHSLATGHSFDAEIRLLRNVDQMYRWHLVRAEATRFRDGVIETWMGICTDIEERRQVETTLKAANQALAEARDKAVEASHAKSLFLANMSHEFRTPLNAILGYAEILQEEFDEGTAQAKEDARRIILAGKHLLSLIDDVLDMAKIEAGKMRLTVSNFNIVPLTEQVVSSVTNLADQRQNKLTLDIDASIGSMNTDEVKVRQILFNLLSNACKFTDNGDITITGVRQNRDGIDWVMLAVQDTGIGIAKRDSAKLFKEFSQGDASATRNYDGTGLGLALSQRFAHLMGGQIMLESQPGSGSTFTVMLPAEIPEGHLTES